MLRNVRNILLNFVVTPLQKKQIWAEYLFFFLSVNTQFIIWINHNITVTLNCSDFGFRVGRWRNAFNHSRMNHRGQTDVYISVWRLTVYIYIYLGASTSTSKWEESNSFNMIVCEKLWFKNNILSYLLCYLQDIQIAELIIILCYYISKNIQTDKKKIV